MIIVDVIADMRKTIDRRCYFGTSEYPFESFRYRNNIVKVVRVT